MVKLWIPIEVFIFSFSISRCWSFTSTPIADALSIGRCHGLQCRNSNIRLQLQRNAEDEQDGETEIPQLPAIGASSFNNSRKNKETKDTPKSTAFVGHKFELQYTCNVCNTRNSHRVSRVAYREGVVVAICKGCQSKHMIADNLGSNSLDGSANIEDYFKAKGEEDNVNRVSQDVFDLEKILNFDSEGGAIAGDDGNPVLE